MPRITWATSPVVDARSRPVALVADDPDAGVAGLRVDTGLGLGWRAVNQMRARRGLPPNVRLP